MRRRWFALWALGLLLLAGCALDSEEELRQTLTKRLYIHETIHFASTGSCTAAVYGLAKPEFRSAFPVAASYGRALEKIAAGEDVLFGMTGQTPNEISEEIMSRDLPRGLGLISAGIGPAKACMDERIALGFYRVLMSDQTQMAYLPSENALLFVYPPERLAFFLRGNV